MTTDELNNAYFEWMYQLVCNGKRAKRQPYRKLLCHLHNVGFISPCRMDSNRAEDGVCLRYRFGREQDHPEAMVATFLDCRQCSVLEMMVALTIRCEECIMDDPSVGNRTGQWFWNMVATLGLAAMNDAKFNRNYVDNAVSRFLNRTYKSNGEGGLFVVNHGGQDLRNVEIWYQMCWYLDNIL